MRKQDDTKMVLFIGAVIAELLLMKYVVPYFLPLLAAIIIVVPLHKLCLRKGWCRRKGKGFMAGGVLFALLLFLILLLIGIGTFLLSRTQDFLKNLTLLEAECLRLLSDFCHRMELYSGLEDGVIEIWLQDRMSGMFGNLSLEGSAWITGTLHYLVKIGRGFTFGLVTFVCVVLFAREIDRWQQGLLDVAVLAPVIDRLLSVILRIGKKLGSMLKSFFKTQGVIFVCISVTASVGLCLGGVWEFWFYGILAGVMDVLPFIGTGIILVPIGVVQLIGGKMWQAIIIFLTYLICIIIREVLEPRLMGSGLRISPVAALISVYSGVLFFGIGGVLSGPVTLLIIAETAKEIFGEKD